MQKKLQLKSEDYFISLANTVAVEKRENQDDFPLHCHDFNELVIVLSGHGMHYWNGEIYPITCGDIFYIDAADYHSYHSVNALKLVNILYRYEKLHFTSLINRYLPGPNLLEQKRYWQIHPSYLSQIKPLLDQLAQETKKSDMVSIHLSETLFLQLMIVLYRFRHHPAELAFSSVHQLDLLFTKLHQSISKSFDLDEFAAAQQVSSRSLRRLFKDKTGMTIMGYLQQLRLCKAMRLLRNTRYSISTIAAECGYEDSNYFSTVFHKETKLTASAYRRYFQNNTHCPVNADRQHTLLMKLSQ